MRQIKLIAQSKLVLLLVLPFAGASLVLQIREWTVNFWPAAVLSLTLSLLLGLLALKLGAATAGGAWAGAVITACMIFSTETFTPAGSFPYAPWHTALVPLLTLFVLTHIATRFGGRRKEALGTAERHEGRNAAQVAANLGIAAMAFSEPVQSWLTGFQCFSRLTPTLLLAIGLAALAEAAADTFSSEIGQVLDRQPRMITTLRTVEPGSDGAVSLIGSLAGAAAAVAVAFIGTLALGGGRWMLIISSAGGVFGLFADSLLGATLERRGWLNNDAVNFLSSACAAVFALGLLALLPHP
ncbi:MAG: DUF92 domain-containing protein [Terracidiphilus sp.]